MFLDVTHKKLDVYIASSELVLECYKVSSLFPSQEKFNLIQQIRRAALSVKLNIAEGASRKSAIERKRFYEIARGSIVELDAAFEVAVSLQYPCTAYLTNIQSLLSRCYSMLTKMVR